jgi:hypothetical protein
MHSGAPASRCHVGERSTRSTPSPLWKNPAAHAMQVPPSRALYSPPDTLTSLDGTGSGCGQAYAGQTVHNADRGSFVGTHRTRNVWSVPVYQVHTTLNATRHLLPEGRRHMPHSHDFVRHGRANGTGPLASAFGPCTTCDSRARSHARPHQSCQ